MQSGYNLDAATFQRHGRLWTILLVLVIFGVGFSLGRLGLGQVSAEDPRWELVIASRLTLHKALIAPALAGTAFLSANGLFWAWDRLKIARRLTYFVMKPNPGRAWSFTAESTLERKERLANAGRVYCSLLLGCFLLAAAVLCR
ncbi:MAG: hypothetical protein HYZ13_09255 [Acidobacteria bacterium]|nr:hypothetical protein [Acidobacteriota bacterium]